MSVSFLSAVFWCGPKNGYFFGAVFWPPILARRGEAQLSGLTPVGQKLRPENGHCFGDRVWEAIFWTSKPGPPAGHRLWSVFWSRFGCCVLVSGLCPSCDRRFVLNLSCEGVCGPAGSGDSHMYVIHSNASSYSHIYIHIYICIHVLIYVLRDGHQYVNVHIYIYAGYYEVHVHLHVRNAVLWQTPYMAVFVCSVFPLSVVRKSAKLVSVTLLH